MILFENEKLVVAKNGKFLTTTKAVDKFSQEVVDEVYKFAQTEGELVYADNQHKNAFASTEKREEEIKKEMQEITEKIKSTDKLLEKKKALEDKIEDLKYDIEML